LLDPIRQIRSGKAGERQLSTIAFSIHKIVSVGVDVGVAIVVIVTAERGEFSKNLLEYQATHIPANGGLVPIRETKRQQ
jgi:hypothetical protein